MKAVLTRTGSMSVHLRFVSGSPKLSLPRHDSIGESFSRGDRSIRISLNTSSLRRVSSSSSSETAIIRSGGAGSKSTPARIPEKHGYKSKIGDYYREKLRSNPNNSLLLMNYGRFLCEVERDVEGAEECYGRAMLAGGGDGQVLALYGKLIWETQRDETRAMSYFDLALHADPNNSMVLGS